MREETGGLGELRKERQTRNNIRYYNERNRRIIKRRKWIEVTKEGKNEWLGRAYVREDRRIITLDKIMKGMEEEKEKEMD